MRVVVHGPVGGDRLQRHLVGDVPVGAERDAAGVQVVAVVEVGVDPEGIAGGRRKGAEHRSRPGGRARGARPVARGVEVQPHHEIRAWPVFEGQAAGDLVLVAVAQAIEIGVLGIALAPRERDRRLGQQRVADQRSADRASELHQVVVADRSLRPRRQLWLQGAGDELHRSADGVAAIECALRPAQHLDTVDVVDRQERPLGPAQIDVVDIDPDAGVGKGQAVDLADPADIDHSVGRIAHMQGQVGDRALEIADVAGLHGVQGIAADRRDRHRYVLQPLATPPGGDHDFLDSDDALPIGRGARFLRQYGCGQRRGQDQAAAGPKKRPRAMRRGMLRHRDPPPRRPSPPGGLDAGKGSRPPDRKNRRVSR